MLLILLVLAVAEMFVGRAVYPNGLVGFVQIGLTDGGNQNLHTHTPRRLPGLLWRALTTFPTGTRQKIPSCGEGLRETCDLVKDPWLCRSRWEQGCVFPFRVDDKTTRRRSPSENCVLFVRYNGW